MVKGLLTGQLGSMDYLTTPLFCSALQPLWVSNNAVKHHTYQERYYHGDGALLLLLLLL